jgi:HSP20 family protein
MISNTFTGIEKQNRLSDNGHHLIKIKPAVDIYEKDNSIIVAAEMPNVEKKNIQISIENGILRISGKRIKELDNANYLMRETSDLIYERFFELEDDLDSQQIEAKYKSGILQVSIEKKEKSKPQIIEIK